MNKNPFTQSTQAPFPSCERDFEINRRGHFLSMFGCALLSLPRFLLSAPPDRLVHSIVLSIIGTHTFFQGNSDGAGVLTSPSTHPLTERRPKRSNRDKRSKQIPEKQEKKSFDQVSSVQKTSEIFKPYEGDIFGTAGNYMGKSLLSQTCHVPLFCEYSPS